MPVDGDLLSLPDAVILAIAQFYQAVAVFKSSLDRGDTHQAEQLRDIVMTTGQEVENLLAEFEGREPFDFTGIALA